VGEEAEHRIEGRGELGVPIPDQELQAASVIIDAHQQVVRLLDHLLPRGMRGDPGQVHPAGAVLDEEQHIQAAQEHGVDMEEVRGQNRLRLGVQERPPGLPGRPTTASVP
jgi:hypothetical protein